MTATTALLCSGALVAGFIDSLAGGGGLITVPLLMMALGPGAHAIGTNKIVGTLAAAVALAVYARGSRISWKRGAIFLAGIAAGAFLGSRLSPLVPPSAFVIFLAVTCPVILACVWKRELWIRAAEHVPHDSKRASTEESLRTFASGLACGFYDGVWGPGGGTFMLLSLLFVVRLPLADALVTSKLANVASAGISLFNFWRGDYVHWEIGLPMGAAISAGAFLGARLGSRFSARAVRPALAVVSLLLLARLAATHWG